MGDDVCLDDVRSGGVGVGVVVVVVVLCRQLQLLSLEHLGDVQVEEVAVEHGLHAPGHDGDDVVEAWRTRESGSSIIGHRS